MSSQTSSPQGVRSRWGRSRFGGSSAVLLTASALLGVLLSSGLGALFATFGGNRNPWLAFGIVGVITLPISIALIWALLVDRTSIAGATGNPEESIETAWYDRAASGAFTDLMAMIGLGSGGFALSGLSIAPDLLLIALFTLAAVDFGLRYWLTKRADS